MKYGCLLVDNSAKVLLVNKMVCFKIEKVMLHNCVWSSKMNVDEMKVYLRKTKQHENITKQSVKFTWVVFLIV